MLSFLMLYSSCNDVSLYDSKKSMSLFGFFISKSKARKSEERDPACEVAAALWPA